MKLNQESKKPNQVSKKLTRSLSGGVSYSKKAFIYWPLFEGGFYMYLGVASIRGNKVFMMYKGMVDLSGPS